ncbi:hypothetical protein EQO05_12680 [Methanosarcina sp. MSH10X1]|uniref:hypothetical protein n=1 Tax=Methanosarcina sp. MSH10X1 TaxID=2507075 RepID=UPI000FFC404F|nr:hypothetical protein [Methanosarcina sp. MSH10X1]RXA17278.1 hypothetical protein EQO05_12680 [Methanosarcina sp. MSH10X1]
MKPKTILILIFVLVLMSTTAGAAKTTVNPHEGRTYMVGGDGKLISIVNYDNAKNPTYSQLVKFIKSDLTDKKKYTSTYVCSDFAEDVHNNAERAGIKAGWVAIKFKRGPGHACNAFQTTDKGPVYIDCTGSPSQKGSFDKVITLKNGKSITTRSLYPPMLKWSGMGTVKSFKAYW